MILPNHPDAKCALLKTSSNLAIRLRNERRRQVRDDCLTKIYTYTNARLYRAQYNIMSTTLTAVRRHAIYALYK